MPLPSSTTKTCPDGSQPDSSGKCPTTLNPQRKRNSNTTKSSDVNIILVSPHLLSGFPDSAVSWAKAYLRSLGVKLLVCPECHVLRVRPDAIYLKNENQITYTMFIWIGGVSAHSLLRMTGLELGEKGRVVVSKYLQAEARQDIFVVGDAALVFDNKGKALPTSAYVAELIKRKIS